MPTGLAAVSTPLGPGPIVFPADGVAIAQATKHVTDGRPHAADDPLPSATGSVTVTVVRQPDGAWLVAAIQTTPQIGIPEPVPAAAG